MSKIKRKAYHWLVALLVRFSHFYNFLSNFFPIFYVLEWCRPDWAYWKINHEFLFFYSILYIDHLLGHVWKFLAYLMGYFLWSILLNNSIICCPIVDSKSKRVATLIFSFEQIKPRHRWFTFWSFNLKAGPHYQSGMKI